MSTWLTELKPLAARRAELRRVVAMDYGEPGAPELGALWLDFEGSPPLELSTRSDGQGFDLAEGSPDPEETAFEDGPAVRDLGGEPPFAAVVGTRLETVGLITWPIPQDDEPPVDFPVGLRLRFQPGEAWILNVGDRIDLFDARPPFWTAYELSELAVDDDRWGREPLPEWPGNRWFAGATPVWEEKRRPSLLRRLLRRGRAR